MCLAFLTLAPQADALNCDTGFADFSKGSVASFAAAEPQTWLPGGTAPAASLRLRISENQIDCEAPLGTAYLGPHAYIGTHRVFEVSVPSSWFNSNGASVVVALESAASTHAQILGASGFQNLAAVNRLFAIRAQLFGGDASTLLQARAGSEAIGDPTALSLDGFSYGRAVRNEQTLRWNRRLTAANPRVFISATGSASVRYSLAGQSSPGAITVADLEARAAISLPTPSVVSQSVASAPVTIREVNWSDVALATGQPLSSVQPGFLTFAAFDGTGDASDADGDGVSDYNEIAMGSAPLAADTDRDGINDGMDAAVTTPSHSPDSDGDGLGDALELIIGTSPLNGDSDGDGFSDGEEIALASNPLVANSSVPVPDDESSVLVPPWLMWHLYNRPRR